MKNKKIIIIFTVIFIMIFFAGYFGIKYAKNNKNQDENQEYTPQEEITDEQFRQTIVSLYFINKENGAVTPEARLVDIRDVVNNPYEQILQLLLDGPKSDKLQTIIPEGTKIIKTYTEKDCLTIDVSNEFLNFNKESKEKLINSILNTMTELTEINSIRFLINGNENTEFSETYTRKK